MKNVMLSVVIGCAVLMAATRVVAEEKTLTGTVTVAQDDDGNVTGVTLTTDDGTAYAVKLDENGKKLAEMKDKTTVVTGEVGEDKSLTVTSFKEKAADE